MTSLPVSILYLHVSIFWLFLHFSFAIITNLTLWKLKKIDHIKILCIHVCFHIILADFLNHSMLFFCNPFWHLSAPQYPQLFSGNWVFLCVICGIVLLICLFYGIKIIAFFCCISYCFLGSLYIDSSGPV